MSEALLDKLQDIHGIGPAKADEILSVVKEHTNTDDAVDVEQLLAHIPPGQGRRRAKAYLKDHDHV